MNKKGFTITYMVDDGYGFHMAPDSDTKASQAEVVGAEFVCTGCGSGFAVMLSGRATEAKRIAQEVDRTAPSPHPKVQR